MRETKMKRVTIQELRSALDNFAGRERVMYDRFGLYAYRLGSWRGRYAEPAIGWTEYHSKLDDLITVEALKRELDDALRGATYVAWKGGEFSFRGDQVLWVDRPGECTDTVIVGVASKHGQCLLLTGNTETHEGH